MSGHAPPPRDASRDSLSGEGLEGAVRRVRASKSAGERAVVVALVADASGRGLPVGARLFVPEQGEVAGSIDPTLDETLIMDARHLLPAKKPGTRSYRATTEGWEYVGVQGGDVQLFFEVLERPPRLIIVGCGHIAVPLARAAKLLEFEVICLDDRPEYASRERFPDADRILVGPYRETLASCPIDSDTYIVLVTRGHVHDQACLEEVLDSPAAYIGMIGSQRRVRTVMSHLKAEGRKAAALERVYAPIGLDVAARTPAEIAIAIAAEMVNVRRGGHAPSLALKERLRV